MLHWTWIQFRYSLDKHSHNKGQRSTCHVCWGWTTCTKCTSSRHLVAENDLKATRAPRLLVRRCVWQSGWSRRRKDCAASVADSKLEQESGGHQLEMAYRFTVTCEVKNKWTCVFFGRCCRQTWPISVLQVECQEKAHFPLGSVRSLSEVLQTWGQLSSRYENEHMC